MDLYSTEGMYDSFRKYQSALLDQFDRLAEEYHFEVVDARPGPREIFESLREGILRRLAPPDIPKQDVAAPAPAASSAAAPSVAAPGVAAEPAPVRALDSSGRS